MRFLPVLCPRPFDSGDLIFQMGSASVHFVFSNLPFVFPGLPYETMARPQARSNPSPHRGEGASPRSWRLYRMTSPFDIHDSRQFGGGSSIALSAPRTL